MTTTALIALAVASIASAAATPSPSGTPVPCGSAEHRQFDFWLGHWTVYDTQTRQPAGRNVVSRIEGECALQEHWTGVDGGTGTSFNIYYAPDRRWHQTWVDSNGLLLQLDGGLEKGRMVLSGTRVNRKGARVTDRIVWTPQNNGDVRQVWEYSEDGGKTWHPVFDGTYVKAN